MSRTRKRARANSPQPRGPSSGKYTKSDFVSFQILRLASRKNGVTQPEAYEAIDASLQLIKTTFAKLKKSKVIYAIGQRKSPNDHMVCIWRAFK